MMGDSFYYRVFVLLLLGRAGLLLIGRRKRWVIPTTQYSEQSVVTLPCLVVGITHHFLLPISSIKILEIVGFPKFTMPMQVSFFVFEFENARKEQN